MATHHFNRDTLPTLREVIANHDLRAEKKFGQNFLLDQNITDKIIRCSENLDDVNAIEIGPGPGGLTRSLLYAPTRSVTAIEFDPRAIIALQHLCIAAGDRLNLIEGDALTKNLMDLAPAPRAIIANLPYNIATPLLIGWLSQIADHGDQAYASMTLMFQKEVTDRIVANVGEKSYGRLSVLCQWLCHVRQAYILPAEAFTPPPKVKSAIVVFKPKNMPADKPDFNAVEKVTEAAFGQRRKMIRQSLKKYSNAIEKLGIDPTLRAENLSVDDYINIAKIGKNEKENVANLTKVCLRKNVFICRSKII